MTASLSKSFAELVDPNRRAILAQFSSGEWTVTALAKPLQLSQPATFRHLKTREFKL